MIRTTRFIEQNIPIGPTDRTGVEIPHERTPIAFTQGPVGDAFWVKSLHATLGKQKVDAGKSFLHSAEVFKHHRAPRPCFVPVKAQAPDIGGGFRIAKQNAGTLIDQVAVMIPSDNLFFA